MFDLDAEAFAASGGDVDGVDLAALDLVQHGLAGDAEHLGGLAEGQPAGGDVRLDAVAQGLVDADPPGRAGGLLAGEEAVPQPPVDRGLVDAEELRGVRDAGHDGILSAGTDISVRSGAVRDAAGAAQGADPVAGPGQPGRGAAVLPAQDLGDGGVVVIPGQARDQGEVSSLVVIAPAPRFGSGMLTTVVAVPCQAISRSVP